MNSDLPHIDEAHIADLKVIMAEDFELLVHTFLSDSQNRLTGLQENLCERDTIGFTRACHSLKGSASNVGALRLADLCLRGEQNGVDHDLLQAEQLLVAMTTEFNVVASVLQGQLYP